MDAIDIADDVFKFVGSERDPKLLQEAQANWQIANGMEHDDASKESFKNYASIQIMEASDVLHVSGFEKEAAKLKGLAEFVKPSQDIGVSKAPAEYAMDMYLRQHERNTGRYGNEIYKMTSEDSKPEDIVLEEKLSKLSTIASSNAARNDMIREREGWDRVMKDPKV